MAELASVVAILRASQPALTALRLLGAASLAYFGIGSIVAALCRVRRAFDAVTGVVLVALGLRLAARPG